MTNSDPAGQQLTQNDAFYRRLSRENEETEIDLKELLSSFLSHLVLILFLAILGAAITTVYTYHFVTPMYEATSKLYVLNSSDSAINLADLQIGTYLANDYIEVFKTWEVHEMVLKDLDLHYSYSYMQHMLEVENPKDTRILTITVKSPDPKEAAAIANEYANVAIKFIAGTMATEEPNVMSVALVPTAPASPSITRNSLLGFIAGLALGLISVTIRFMKDDKIKTSEDVMRYTGMAVLAVVPVIVINDRNEKKRGKYEA